MILRARILFPVVRPPIENGAAVIAEDRIAKVGAWNDFTASPSLTAHHPVVDLGEVVLLPGLVNAHCHLDYTDMAGLWPPPRSFVDWIPQMLAAKAEWSYADYARSWLNGAKMLQCTGTTTVADIEAVPELLPEMWGATPLRVVSFLEMTGVRSRREPAVILGESLAKIESLRAQTGLAATGARKLPALSPHAPYSTSPELLRLCAQTARAEHLRIATHVAESTQEFEMFAAGRGEMFQWLQRNGRDMGDCGSGSPVRHIERAGLLDENFLAIHANCLAPGDAEILGRHRVHAVHCPRSHDYFRHPPFHRRELAAAGVNLCLGTDSLATVRRQGTEPLELNLFAEMQALAASDKTLSPGDILRMATVNGAQALGLAGRIGELSENAFADLIAIPFSGKVSETIEAVVNFPGRVAASMIGGEWAMAPTSIEA